MKNIDGREREREVYPIYEFGLLLILVGDNSDIGYIYIYVENLQQLHRSPRI